MNIKEQIDAIEAEIALSKLVISEQRREIKQNNKEIEELLMQLAEQKRTALREQ